MNINYRVAWRLNYSNSTLCNQSKIQSGELMGPAGAGYIMCQEGCGNVPVRVGNVLVKCTDYSVSEDWMTGVNNYNYDFPRNGQFVLE